MRSTTSQSSTCSGSVAVEGREPGQVFIRRGPAIAHPDGDASQGKRPRVQQARLGGRIPIGVEQHLISRRDGSSRLLQADVARLSAEVLSADVSSQDDTSTPGALDDLFHHFLPQVNMLIRYFLRNGDEDDVWECYEVALDVLRSTRAEDLHSKLLNSIRHHCAEQRMRRTAARDALDRADRLYDMYVHPEEMPELAAPDQEIERFEMLDDLWHRLQELDEVGMTIVCLTHGVTHDGVPLSTRQVGEELGLSHMTINETKKRLLKAMRSIE